MYAVDRENERATGERATLADLIEELEQAGELQTFKKVNA